MIRLQTNVNNAGYVRVSGTCTYDTALTLSCLVSMRMLPAPRRPRLVLAAAVAAIIVHTANFVGRVCAYDVPINTHKIDFWDTNQVGVA